MASLLALVAIAGLALAQNKPTWNYTSLPAQTEQGQVGFNNCNAGTAGPNSDCQTAVFNSASDFCVFAPQQPNSLVGSVEESVVSWCMPGNTHGARTIPTQAFSQLHWVQTPNYIQIRAKGDFTQLNARRGDGGGELDPHGATGNGNPIGSLVFTSAFGGGVRQVKEWMSFVAYNELCFRACNPDDPNAWLWCQHVYDEQGCDWVMPGQAGAGFSNCLGNSEVAPPGVAPGWASTWFQGQPNQPSAHPAPAVSNCQDLNYLGQSAQQLTIVGPATPSSSSSSSALPMTSSTSSSISLVTPTTSANVYVASTMFSSSSTALPAAPSSLTGAAGRTSVFAPLVLSVLGFALFL